MTRLAVFAIPVLVGIPLASAANWHTGALAVAAGALLATGMKRASLRVTTAGGMLAIAELALALSSKPPELALLRATVVGLALLYIVEEVNYAGRFASAHVDAAAQRARLRARLQQGIAALATSALLAALASGVAAHLALPVFVRIAMGGIGALVALFAALAGAAGLSRSAREGHPSPGTMLKSRLKQKTGPHSD